MIPLLARRSITLLRYGATTYVDGRPVVPEPTEVQISAAVVPASEATIDRLPEGVRTDHAVTLYSYSEIRSFDEATGANADRFTFAGRTYEVQETTRYPAFAGQPPHWEATAIQTAALTQPEGA